MDEIHTLACARYIERNPVRAKMVQKPHLWEWSSARAHCGINKYDELGVNVLFDYIEKTQETWRAYIEMPDNPEEIKRIREQTRKGRISGDNNFVERLESKLNRFLRLKPKGRPKKRE